MERAKDLLRQRELKFKEKVDGATGGKGKNNQHKTYEISENSSIKVRNYIISIKS